MNDLKHGSFFKEVLGKIYIIRIDNKLIIFTLKEKSCFKTVLEFRVFIFRKTWTSHLFPCIIKQLFVILR